MNSKKMRKAAAFLSALLSSAVLSACSDQSADPVRSAESSAEYSISSLKGPTSIGMVKMMALSDESKTANRYSVTIHGSAEEVTADVLSGSADIANVPANLAAILYKKTEKTVKITDINTLGVLYVVSSGEDITDISQLKGKTVYSTGKGTTPEYVLNHILTENGLVPQTDVTIEYRSEATECAALMAESDGAIAVLPQPFVTTAMMKNDRIKVCLSLTDEWDKISTDPLITGVTIAQAAVIEKDRKAFDSFLSDYESSVKYVNDNLTDAAELSEKYDIVPKAVAERAIPMCHITFIRGDDMKNALNGYWNVLFTADPASTGGEVPDEGVFLAE